MHASSDIRIVKCLDGLHYSFEMLYYIHSSLYLNCAKIKSDQSMLIPTLLQSWSFIDIVNRIREISLTLPGLSQSDHNLVVFLDSTKLAEEYRHYIQHLRRELLKQIPNPFPVWGSLAWVDTEDSTTSYIVFIGAMTSDISYSGCCFDMVEQRWISRVCLGIAGKSFNFDLIFESCARFREFIMPWIFANYSPGVKITSQLPVVTMRVLSLEHNNT